MLIQTDLYSFGYKLGTLVPWCKKCGAEKFHRDGTTKNGKQLYECVKCGFRFVWTSDFPRRNFFSNVISFAVDLYTTIGVSLRTLANRMKKYFDIKVSHEGIRQWVLAAEKLDFKDDKTCEAKVWHVDETHIKIKGKGFWLWVVYAPEIKQVLAWYISKKRLFKDAKEALNRALEKTNGVKPEKIVTDGLYQYDAAIKKVIGWNWRIQKLCHIKDSGIGKNAILERVNREVKRRFKWFGTFQALDGARAFFAMFFYHFNKNRVNSTELT